MTALTLARNVARAVFRLRGDRTEVHLTERELAAIVALALSTADATARRSHAQTGDAR